MTVIMLTLMVSGRHGPALAGDTVLVNVRAGVSGELTRFVMDLDGPADFHTFTLDDPARIVVDLPQVSRTMSERERGIDAGLIVRARFGTPAVDMTRVVLDLVEPGVVQDTLVLEPEGEYGHRIVLDIAPRAAPVPSDDVVEDDGFLKPGIKPLPACADHRSRSRSWRPGPRRRWRQRCPREGHCPGRRTRTEGNAGGNRPLPRCHDP